MTVRTIVTIGAPLLRQPTKPLAPERVKSDEIQRLIGDMTITMLSAKGVGIAAPQIGVGYRLAIIQTKDGPFPIVNPTIINHGKKSNIEEEGCLSIPGVFGTVRRWDELTLEFLDRQGQIQSLQASGFMARVLQHEVDHLDGILFIDKVIEITQGRLP